MQFLYVQARNSDGVILDTGGVAIAVQRRATDDMLLVAMVKCPDHQLFDEAKSRAQAAARLNSGCYIVMTAEALAKYVKQSVESLKAALVFDTSAET